LNKIIIFFIVLIVSGSICFIVYQHQTQIAINNNYQKVTNYINELKALNCSITKMTLDEVSLAGASDREKEWRTWNNDPFGSIRWVSEKEFKQLVSESEFTYGNSFVRGIIKADLHSLALIDEGNGNYVILTIETVMRQTVWSYEHIGLKFPME